MKYAWIARHRDSYPVDLMCSLLNVARSGFFARLHGKLVSPRKAEDAKLLGATRDRRSMSRFPWQSALGAHRQLHRLPIANVETPVH